LVTFLVRSLVDKPDQVELRSAESEGARVFELKVAQEDIGKVIGRDGRTVNAIRTLLSAAAQKQGLKARLEIRDDRRAEKSAGAPAIASEPAPEPS
jgi:predicted RNA-binding protein YlqC (UPF0109 family)